jgi:hypothetical protein
VIPSSEIIRYLDPKRSFIAITAEIEQDLIPQRKAAISLVR